MKQVKSLRSAFATLREKKVTVIGVSMDTVAEQKAFADKFQIPFPLLADTRGEICDAFNVARAGNFPRRETFIFHKGRLVSHDRNVVPKRQAEDILRVVDSLPAR